MHVARRLSAPKIALISVGSVVVILAILVFALAYFFLGIFHSNKAQAAVAPLTQKIVAIGGRELCDSGWNGYGPADTDGPWYQAYYLVPDGPRAQRTIFAEAKAMGYPLSVEEGEPPDPKSKIYISGRGGDGLTVAVYHNVNLAFCDGDSTKTAVSGDAAVYWISSPDVKN